MNYIGSKFKLLGEIRSMLFKHGVDCNGIFCDIFSGTTVVAQLAKQLGFTVISNDIQAYSHALQCAFIESNGYPDFSVLREAIPEIDTIPEAARSTFGISTDLSDLTTVGAPLLRVLAYLDNIPGKTGAFVDHYCDGGREGRKYFSCENGMACQAIRDTLEEWRNLQLISEPEFSVLLASLLESIDMVANTASVYGAHLKHLKKTALQPLRLKAPLLMNGAKPHRCYREDSNTLIRKLAEEGEYELLYIDPPYNRRQYASNYHLLETICRWDLDEFTPAGQTGLRPAGQQRSAYAMRSTAKAAMADLLSHSRFRHILVSYSNEGLIPEEELVDLLDAVSPSGVRDYHKLAYRRFRADNDSPNRIYKADEVQEFLFYVQTG